MQYFKSKKFVHSRYWTHPFATRFIIQFHFVRYIASSSSENSSFIRLIELTFTNFTKNFSHWSDRFSSYDELHHEITFFFFKVQNILYHYDLHNSKIYASIKVLCLLVLFGLKIIIISIPFF